MFDNLSPKTRRWGAIVVAVAALAWLGFNPDMLFEDPEQTTAPQSRQIDNSRTGNSAITGVENGFDFYVLALSWSPSFCASQNRTTGMQCGGKRFFSFVVHGLWPQFEKGWPSYCDENTAKVSDRLTRSMLDIMPAYGLIQQQWRKHGTCTGLDQQSYFAKLRQAYEKIRFPVQYRLNDGYKMVSPQEVERAFQTENPGIPSDAIAVTCDKRRLREVRICFSKSLGFRSCQQVDRNSCRKQKVVLPPVRGT